MTLARIKAWKDGDSGEMVDGYGRTRRFRLDNVNAPEKRAPGYNLSTARSRRMVRETDIVDVEIMGVDTYGRDIVKIKKRGRDVNKILEMKNKLFTPNVKKSKKGKGKRKK